MGTVVKFGLWVGATKELKTKGFEYLGEIRMMLGRITTRALSTGARQVEDVFIVSAARTPLGSMEGCLKGVTATQLGSNAIRASVERAGVEPNQVEDVYMGCVLQVFDFVLGWPRSSTGSSSCSWSWTLYCHPCHHC